MEIMSSYEHDNRFSWGCNSECSFVNIRTKQSDVRRGNDECCNDLYPSPSGLGWSIRSGRDDKGKGNGSSESGCWRKVVAGRERLLEKTFAGLCILHRCDRLLGLTYIPI